MPSASRHHDASPACKGIFLAQSQCIILPKKFNNFFLSNTQAIFKVLKLLQKWWGFFFQSVCLNEGPNKVCTLHLLFVFLTHFVHNSLSCLNFLKEYYVHVEYTVLIFLQNICGLLFSGVQLFLQPLHSLQIVAG